MKQVATNLLSEESAHKNIQDLNEEARVILTENKRIPYTLKFKFALSKDNRDIILEPIDAVIINSVHDEDLQKLYTSQHIFFEGRPATARARECFSSKMKKSISFSHMFDLLGDSYDAKKSLKMQIVDELNKKFANKLSFQLKAEVDNYGSRDFMDLFFGREHFPLKVVSKSESKFITAPHLVNASSIFFFYSDVNRNKLNQIYKKIKALKEYLVLIEEKTKVENLLNAKVTEVRAIKI